MAQRDFFLKIDGIPGESTDEKHKGEIEIESWNWSAQNTGTMGYGGGGGAGKADFSDITFSKHVDKSTPKLLKAVGEGQHIKEVLLTCRKASGAGGQVDYLKVTLNDVMVSGYSSSASEGNPVANESISLNYAKIKYEYAPQKNDGSLEGFVAASYDRHMNKAA